MISDPPNSDPLSRSKVESGELTEPAFMDELQRRMERVVLGLQSGSYAQRVQVWG